MFRKVFAYASALFLIPLVFLGTPAGVHAGGVCGGTYIVEPGETVNMLAAMCGTSTDAIYAANPGISSTLTTGQVLTIPGPNYNAAGVTVVYNDPTYYYTYFYYQPAVGNASTYTVQSGDTFAKIAVRYGISMNELWGANPQIWDVNLLYAGQVLYIPAAYSVVTPPVVSSGEPTALSYAGDIPKNASTATVRLVNKADADVYVSLRTARADGTNAINEFPVNRTVIVEIPSGWIDYVAWVGGVKYTGGFLLQEGSVHTLTFNRSKVAVD